MIQYPINVMPCGMAIDAAKNNSVSYTFNGDCLSAALYRFFDYDTGKIAGNMRYERTDGTPWGYNGYTINHSFPTNMFAAVTNGKRYIMQMMLVQMSEDGSEPICDMPVLGGKVEFSADKTKIYVASGITSIYPWNKQNGGYISLSASNNSTVDRMIIKIGNETRNISTYFPEETIEGKTYGCIVADNPFSADITEGTNYEVYSNFIITPQYYFTCKASPEVSLTYHCYSNRLYCKGMYSQAQNSMIKYYKLKLYWSNNSYFQTHESTGEKAMLVEETNKIYSQNIAFDFWNPYQHDENFSHGTTDYYQIECETTTQDDMVCTFKSEVITLTPKDYSGLLGNTLYAFDLSWDKEKGRVIHALRGYGSAGIGAIGSYELFREDLDSGKTVQLLPHHYTTAENATIYGYDLTASTHGNYKYTLKLFDSEGKIIIPDISADYNGIGNFPCSTIRTSELAYYITDLDMQEDSDLIYHPNSAGTKKLTFKTGDTWKFVGEIQDTTVTNNLDRMTHVGYGQYVSSTSTDVNYMSGTLSAMIGYANCTTKEYVDNIALVRAWRKFITQKKPFLLKSQKGDVWIVNITDNPTTQYQEDRRTVPTTFSFSWAESYNINDVILHDSDSQG